MVLSCIDPRFQPIVYNYLKKKRLNGKYSSFTITGSAVGVTANKFKRWHKVFWDNFETSVKLHNIKKLIVSTENYNVKLLSFGFFAELDQAVVWRGPMAVKALRQLIFDADWGDLDYLIIDTPPGTGDVHLSIVQNLPLTGVAVVTTPQAVALADAKKAIAMFKMENINVPILGLVENMSWFTPKEHPDEKYFIFGKNGGKDLCESLNINLIGQIPLVQSIRESADVGRPAVLQQETNVESYYQSACENLLSFVDQRNEKLDQTKVVPVEYGDPKCSSNE